VIGTSDQNPTLSLQARRFVRELLLWDLSVARAETAAKGSVSSTAVVLEVLQVGVIGTGCAGTKGVGRAPREDREPPRTDSLGAAKYRLLSVATREVADAVLADGQGDVLVSLRFGQRVYEVTFPARIRLRLALPAQRERWAAKIAQGDPRPAIAGAEALALPRLESAAREWVR
jgi:hypothetical protein